MGIRWKELRTLPGLPASRAPGSAFLLKHPLTPLRLLPLWMQGGLLN